jgi:hypothetical protein
MTDSEGSPLLDNVIFIVLLAGAIVLVGLMVWGRMNGGETWADITIKEISRTINMAEPGDKIEIDIHDESIVAKRNDVPNLDEIFSVDNEKNQACLKLSKGTKRCFYFFNEVDITNIKLVSGAFTETERNLLTFEIAESGQEVPEQNE